MIVEIGLVLEGAKWAGPRMEAVGVRGNRFLEEPDKVGGERPRTLGQRCWCRRDYHTVGA